MDSNKKQIPQAPPVENYQKFLKEDELKHHYEPHFSNKKVEIPKEYHEGHDKCLPQLDPNDRYTKEEMEKTKHILEDHLGNKCPVHQQSQEPKKEGIWDKTKKVFSTGIDKVKKFFTS